MRRRPTAAAPAGGTSPRTSRAATTDSPRPSKRERESERASEEESERGREGERERGRRAFVRPHPPSRHTLSLSHTHSLTHTLPG
eukprot:1060632-Rhodomonas_salina.3